MELITAGRDSSLPRNVPDRPSFSGVGSGYLSTPTPTSQGLRWFDPASFIVSPQGTFGNVGRNTMITPHFQSIDMALAKRFNMPYSVNRAIIQQSRKTVVVADHSKFGKVGKTLIAPVAKVDLIITDNSAPRHLSGVSPKVVWV